MAPKGEAYLMAASLYMLAGMPRLARYSLPAPGGWASGSTLTTVILYTTNINGYVDMRTVLRIRIHMFLGLLDPDPDPLVRVMDPDPSIIKQKL